MLLVVRKWTGCKLLGIGQVVSCWVLDRLYVDGYWTGCMLLGIGQVVC